MWVSRMPEFIPVFGPRMFRFGGAEVVVHVGRIARRVRAALDQRTLAGGSVLDGVAVAGAEQAAVGVLEVLDLVTVAVPVHREHGVEVAVAIGGRDVRRDHLRVHLADVAVAAAGVEEALLRGIVAARARREARPAAQVHRVAERRAELREVPGAAVLAAEVGVTRRAGHVRRVVRRADDAAGHLGVLGPAGVVEERGRRSEPDAVRDAGVAAGGVEEDLAVEEGGRERVGRDAAGDGRHGLPEHQGHAVLLADAGRRGAAVGVRRAHATAGMVAEADARRAVVVAPAGERRLRAQRRLAGLPSAASGAAAASGTTFRAR